MCDADFCGCEERASFPSYKPQPNPFPFFPSITLVYIYSCIYGKSRVLPKSFSYFPYLCSDLKYKNKCLAFPTNIRIRIWRIEIYVLALALKISRKLCSICDTIGVLKKTLVTWNIYGNGVTFWAPFPANSQTYSEFRWHPWYMFIFF